MMMKKFMAIAHVCMYIVCIYQMDEKGFVCMHRPKKNDRYTLTLSAPGNNT
jgi:hypothetical protein